MVANAFFRLLTKSDFLPRRRHYIWATAAVYFTSVLIRFAVMLNRNGRHIARGHIEVLPDNAVRVTARLPRDSGHAWSAGQHYFVNFVKARPFESHPYTIANAPWRDPSSSVSCLPPMDPFRSLEFCSR